MSPSEAGKTQDPLSLVLDRITAGESAGTDELLPLVYEQLRGIARARLAQEAAGHSLQATALVHEAYLRVRGDRDPGWNGRRHFFMAAAEAMRRILIEQARRRSRLRRGGDLQRQPFDEQVLVEQPCPGDDLLGLQDTLERLESADPRAREIVNCRYFVGLSDQETAEALGLSLRTVERSWKFIRTFLQTRGGPE